MAVALGAGDRSSLQRFATPALFVLATEAVGALGSLVTDTGPWYDRLDKAPFNPPGWVFGPTWIVLYALIGIAASRVYRSDHPERERALRWWTAQLVLNGIWTPVFFGARSPGAGLAVLALLLPVAGYAGLLLARVDRRTGRLYAPYVAWITFAFLLNAWIVVAGATG